MQQLETERLQELIGDDERAVAFLEQQVGSIRRRIESRRAQLAELSLRAPILRGESLIGAAIRKLRCTATD